MKSKDLQKAVRSMYEKGDGTRKIFQELNSTIPLWIIERWCRRIRESGSINLSKLPGSPRIIRTRGAIEKVKTPSNQRNLVSSRKLARELGISRSSVQGILRNNLKIQAYKMQNEPMPTDEHKAKRLKFENWVRTNFRKKHTMKILFVDETLFDIDGIYNSQNDRIWAVNCVEADIKGGIVNFCKKLWFGSEHVLKDFRQLVIFENGKVDHNRYINEVLSVAPKYRNRIFLRSLIEIIGLQIVLI